MTITAELTTEERAYLDQIPVKSWLIGNVTTMPLYLRTHWVEVLYTGVLVHTHDGTGYVRCLGATVKAPLANEETGEFSPDDYRAVQDWLAGRVPA